ncbi:MAG: DUF4388 domain-containing protein, partial [Candidatus Coatesbacteria bacterium]
MPALEGKIEEFSTSEVIQIVAMARKTGTLTIEGVREQISICFMDGKAVYANSIQHRERLGDILVRRGLVKRAVINEALARQRGFKGRGEQVRIGTILVSMGVLTAGELSERVAEQIRESIYLIMAEKSGIFRFTPELNVPPEDIVTGINIEKTILEGTRLVDEWKMIREKIPDFDDVYVFNAELSDRGPVRLTIDEWTILSLLDGRRSINDVIELAELDKLEVCKIIFDFICFG